MKPLAEPGPQALTVASFLDVFLDLGNAGNPERTLYEKNLRLQVFTDDFGRRPVRELLPYYLERRVADHPMRSNVDTKSRVVNQIQTAINLTARRRPIAQNPFA